MITALAELIKDYDCKKLTFISRAHENIYYVLPETDQLYEFSTALARSFRLEKPCLVIRRDDRPRATAGIGKDSRPEIIINTGLLDIVKPIELAAVLAHELAECCMMKNYPWVRVELFLRRRRLPPLGAWRRENWADGASVFLFGPALAELFARHPETTKAGPAHNVHWFWRSHPSGDSRIRNMHHRTHVRHWCWLENSGP